MSGDEEVQKLGTIQTIQHPLLIDLVLETLTEILPRCAIPSCRLVCKKWNQIFVGPFRSKFCVKLTEWKSTEKFVHLLENSPEIPYSRFHISRISMNDPWLETVFEICGNLITHISLELTKDDIDICEFRELLLYRVPNLQELSFDNHEGLPEEVTDHPKLFPLWCQGNLINLKKISLRFSSGKKFHINFLKDLFKAASKLQEINFRRSVDGNSGTNQVFMALKDTKSWETLKILNLGQMENESLKSLISLKENGICLKVFSFDNFHADVERETVEDFLESQCESLEELTLNEYLGNQDLVISYPPMRKLKKLSTTAFEKSQIIPNKPISYYHQFPVLETLAVYGWQNMTKWDIFFSEAENSSPLESLKNLQPPYRINDTELFRKLPKLFPNVTSLDITSPSNEVIMELWDAWNDLKILEIFLDWNNVNVDVAFTGIHLQTCERIRKERTFPDAQNQLLAVNKSICSLRQLRKFVCEIYEPWRDGEPEPEDPTCLLTDISGYGAFFHMSQLQHIFIARSDISKECVQEISTQLPLYTNIDIRGPRRQKL